MKVHVIRAPVKQAHISKLAYERAFFDSKQTWRRKTNVNTSAQLVPFEDDISGPNISVVHLQSHPSERILILVVNKPLPPVANPHYDE